MKNIQILIAVTIAVLLSSCAENSKGTFWGETKYYSNFLFYRYKPIVMEQTLIFDFNDNAQRLIANDIEFEIVEKDANGAFIRAEGIVLKKDGKECPNNILKIKTSEKEVLLGIEFTEQARNGYHTLYLREKGKSGLDRIDYLELTDGFCVKKNKVWNPLAKILFWLLVVVVALILVWVIVLKPLMFETFKVKTLYVIYPEAMKTLRIKGYTKIICSRTKQRQTFISRFFMGKIAFVQNEFWEQDMEIVPKNKKSVRVRPPRGFIVSPSSTVAVGADVEITNNDTSKIVKLKIN